jgi:hypothetical protein
MYGKRTPLRACDIDCDDMSQADDWEDIADALYTAKPDECARFYLRLTLAPDNLFAPANPTPAQRESFRAHFATLAQQTSIAIEDWDSQATNIVDSDMRIARVQVCER